MRFLQVCLLLLTCSSSTTFARESQPPSFAEITLLFHDAFVVQGEASVARLVHPACPIEAELSALFQNKPTSVKLYPPTDEDVGSIQGDSGHDWPRRPIAKLFVQTDGPTGKDFTEAWFTIGLHEGNPVLIAKSFRGIPDWRR